MLVLAVHAPAALSWQSVKAPHANVQQAGQARETCKVAWYLLNNACWLQILLQPSQHELEQRLQQRAAAHTHFMPASLLQSQLALLEVDSSCLRYGERHALSKLPPAVLPSSCPAACPVTAAEPRQASEMCCDMMLQRLKHQLRLWMTS